MTQDTVQQSQQDTSSRLRAENASFGYDQKTISTNLSVAIPDGSFTVIVGPNASGKSTLLRALSRLLRPNDGEVVFDGRNIASYGAKELARQLGLLPQSSTAPDGISVLDLVRRGRYPHQTVFSQWSSADEEAVTYALDKTNTAELSARRVDELSGGQRQRVWIAMALAQETDVLLLDEPTTFLDIAHQIDLLELCAELNQERGRTLVAVLHDLNQAARYATHLIAMKKGAVIAEGDPSEIVTEELVREVFDVESRVIKDPVAGTPLIVPLGGRRGQATPPDHIPG